MQGLITGQEDRSQGQSQGDLPASDVQWRRHCESKFGLPDDLDLRRLAAQHSSVCGSFGVSMLSRATSGLPAQRLVRELKDIEQGASGVVWFEFKGQSHTGRRDTVSLKVQSMVTLTCQRCMQAMGFAVNEHASFELFENEAQLERLDSDEQFDEDMPEPLLVNGPVSLVSLIEDQIILALPYVPKHVQCESDRAFGAQRDAETKRASPFQVLEKLKRTKST